MTKSAKERHLAVVVNGKSYYTVKHFAWLTKRSEQSVRQLISRGNSVRKLKVLRWLNNTLIPAAELTEFPFTEGGTGAVYHYDAEGRVAESDAELLKSEKRERKLKDAPSRPTITPMDANG